MRSLLQFARLLARGLRLGTCRKQVQREGNDGHCRQQGQRAAQ